jgi:hypothetical protein
LQLPEDDPIFSGQVSFVFRMPGFSEQDDEAGANF